MMLPWFIPQLRHIDGQSYCTDISDRSDERAGDIATAGSDTDIHIREYRDESKRTWKDFFNEYEYRYTKDESRERQLLRWFDKDTSATEKRLICKLDVLIAFYSFLGYWVKYLDSSNLNNAYVSGMKEDIGMSGNDLINTQVIFLVGNIIFELPWLFLLPRVSLTYVLFISELIWSIFTLATYRVENPQSLMAFRFIIGAAEAAYFPIIHYTLASWYKSSEVSRRGALFYMGQFLGVLTSGLLQSAASKLHYLKGWQNMFIIDGSVSLAVSLIGLFCLPGTPIRCYSIWLTDEEILLARKRMKDNKTDLGVNVKSFFDKDTWKRILSSWHFWLLSLIQMCGFNTNSGSSGSFALWLKSLDRYSVSKLNNLTALPPGLGMFYTLIVCFGADLTGKRFGFITFSFFMNFIAHVILAVWNVPEAAKWAGFCLVYWSWSQSSVFNPLISDILRHDSNQRAIEWMIIYILGLQSSAWVQRLAFPTTDEPRYLAGYTSCAVFSIAFNIFLVAAYFLYKRDERKKALEYGIFLYDSRKGIPEEVSYERMPVDDPDAKKIANVAVIKDSISI